MDDMEIPPTSVTVDGCDIVLTITCPNETIAAEMGKNMGRMLGMLSMMVQMDDIFGLDS